MATTFGTVEHTAQVAAATAVRRYTFLKDSTTDYQLEVAGAGEANPAGIATTARAANSADNHVNYELAGIGISKVEASAAITAGDKIATAANGLAVEAGSNVAIVGVARESAADGEIFAMRWSLNGTG